MAEVPPETVAPFRERGIEGKPVDAYYLKPSDTWHAIPGFIEVEGKSYLNVGFPYRKSEKASWRIRLPGVDDDRCERIFEAARATLMDERYCYFHEWHEGDTLLIDSLRPLHGREAFQGQRALANILVSARCGYFSRLPFSRPPVNLRSRPTSERLKNVTRFGEGAAVAAERA